MYNYQSIPYERVKEVYESTMDHLELNGFTRHEAIAGLFALCALQIAAEEQPIAKLTAYVKDASDWTYLYFGVGMGSRSIN